MGKEKKKLSEFEKYKKQQNIQNKFNRILAVLMISALVLIFVFGLDYFPARCSAEFFARIFQGAAAFRFRSLTMRSASWRR